MLMRTRGRFSMNMKWRTLRPAAQETSSGGCEVRIEFSLTQLNLCNILVSSLTQYSIPNMSAEMRVFIYLLFLPLSMALNRYICHQNSDIFSVSIFRSYIGCLRR